MHNAPTPLIPNTVSARALDPSTAPASGEHPAAQLHFDEVPLPPANNLLSLSTLRLQKNLTVDAVASALRLSQAQINALEQHNWAALPAAAYVKGFLRNYTRLLGVAAEPYIAHYDAFLQQKSNLIAPPTPAQTSVQTHSPSAQNQPNERTAASALSVQAPLQLHRDPTALASHGSAHQIQSHKTLFSLVGLLIAATALFILYWERAAWLPVVTHYTKPALEWVSAQWANIDKPKWVSSAPASSAPATFAPVTPAQALIAGSAPSLASADAVSANTTPAANSSRSIQFKINKPVWIEVRDSGNTVIYTGTKPAGTKDSLTGNAPLSLIVGAVDAVTMTVDGSAFDLAAKAQTNVARFKLP